MKGYTTALSLSLLMGVVGAASAATAIIDFSDGAKSVDATLVKNADGATKEVKEGTITAAETGGVAGNQYLYVDVKDGLFKAGDPIWIKVEYLDRGVDTWQLEYATDADAVALAQPVVNKIDSKAFKSITFKQVDASFLGQQDGKADLRINDNADGGEVIKRILVSNIDPGIVQFPKVDPAKPVVIDGVKKDGEWDGALTFVLDSKDQDAIQPSALEPGTFAGTYSYKYDDKALYVLGEVVDATPRLNDAEGPSYWNGDGIEVFLALDWSDPNHTTYLEGTDFHLFFGMGETPAWANQNAVETTDNGPLKADMLGIANTDKGYMFELAIPWASLYPGLKIKEGQNIGFYMFANNSTVSPSAQQIALTPYKRNGPSGNPSRWATGVLSTSLKVENPPQ